MAVFISGRCLLTNILYNAKIIGICRAISAKLEKVFIPVSLYKATVAVACFCLSFLYFSLISRSFGSISFILTCVLMAFLERGYRITLTTKVRATIAKPASPPGKMSTKKTKALYNGSTNKVWNKHDNLPFYK